MDGKTLQWQHWLGVDTEITEDIPKKKPFKVKGFGEQPRPAELKSSNFLKKEIK